MKSLGKIAVIGDKSTTLAFKVLGVDVFNFTDYSRIKETLNQLAEDEYSIILLPEKTAIELNDFTEKWKLQPFPIILSIPDGTSNEGHGMEKIKENLIKAIGNDLMLGKEGKK